MDESSVYIQRARLGDNEALESLLALHLPGLRGFLQNRAGDVIRGKETVSDLVQSTCREVLQDLSAHDFEDEVHFKHWLYQAALRKVVDRARHWRAERRDVAREAREPGGADADSVEGRLLAGLEEALGTPSQVAMGREELRRVEAALNRLPKEQRNLILMARFLDLPHREIARQTGQAEGTVRVQLMRALAALKEVLGR
jgi:RNA polymerase sigma factor (sigma-70 family)